MGGAGSGRGPTFDAKTTVEDCHALDVGSFLERGVFRYPWGSIKWFRGDDQTGAIDYTASVDGGPHLVLRYGFARRDGPTETVTETVRLVSTPCHFGGERWWFVCPLVRGGTPCGRRVRKLYLPSGARYFGCRHCYDLTYVSAQEAHKWEAAFGRIAASVGAGCTAPDVRRALAGERRKEPRRG